MKREISLNFKDLFSEVFIKNKEKVKAKVESDKNKEFHNFMDSKEYTIEDRINYLESFFKESDFVSEDKKHLMSFVGFKNSLFFKVFNALIVSIKFTSILTLILSFIIIYFYIFIAYCFFTESISTINGKMPYDVFYTIIGLSLLRIIIFISNFLFYLKKENGVKLFSENSWNYIFSENLNKILNLLLKTKILKQETIKQRWKGNL